MITIKDKSLFPYLIEVDRYEYTVKKYTGKNKKGEPNFSVIGHFSKLESAINRIYREWGSDQKEELVVTLQKYLELYAELENRIKQHVKSISKG